MPKVYCFGMWFDHWQKQLQMKSLQKAFVHHHNQVCWETILGNKNKTLGFRPCRCRQRRGLSQCLTCVVASSLSLDSLWLRRWHEPAPQWPWGNQMSSRNLCTASCRQQEYHTRTGWQTLAVYWQTATSASPQLPGSYNENDIISSQVINAKLTRG